MYVEITFQNKIFKTYDEFIKTQDWTMLKKDKVAFTPKGPWTHQNGSYMQKHKSYLKSPKHSLNVILGLRDCAWQSVTDSDSDVC